MIYKILRNNTLKNLLSAILFGVIYAAISFVDKGAVEMKTILVATALYFLIMCLLYFIVPKPREITGHDTDEC
jgi:NhaP-type Na+/H+ or K+/H+ antiporter